MYTGAAVTLKSFDRAEMERTRLWANDIRLARLIDRVLPVSDVMHENWCLTVQNRQDCVIFAVVANKEQKHIGNVWLWNINTRHRKAELRIIIGEQDFTGRGYGTEAIALILSFAFDYLNLHRVYAYVLSSNPRGTRAFEKAGFKTEGLLKEDRFIEGKYVDTYLLAKVRSY